MGYAVELFYDDESDRAVRRIWDGLGAMLERPSLSELGARPHVSLAVYSDELADCLDMAGFEEILREFAQLATSFEFKLSSVGTFPGGEGVVFLAPVVTRQLLAFHARFHDAFSRHRDAAAPYYRPGQWVPHCTVAIDLAPSEVTKAVDYCREAFRPICGRFEEIGLIEFRPVKELVAVKLG